MSPRTQTGIETDADVVVIGGGPIGLATAIHATLAGLSVLVLEPRTGVNDKACGEGLMPGALASLRQIGVDPGGADLRGIAYTDGTRYVTADFPGGLGRGVRRTELHARLQTRAADLGVTLVPASMRSITQDDHGVSLALTGSTGRGSLRARYAVGADGLHSRTRRQVGLERPSPGTPSGRRFGFRQHFALAPWTDRVEVHWGSGAEVYVTPVASDMVGVAVLSGQRKSLAEHLQDFPDLSRRLSAAPPATSLRAAGPLRQRARSRAAGRVLLVGDAGGYVDALTGEGLAVGLAQAKVAVEALSADAPYRYRRLAAQVSWRSTVLTSGLLYASGSRRVRGVVVPAAYRLPWVFQRAVGELAATAS